MPDMRSIRPGAVDLPGGTYHRLAARCPALRVELTTAQGPAATPGQDWAGMADVELHLDRLIAGEATRILAGHDCTPRDHVAASRLLHHYLWTVCLLVSGPWYLERRVPRIRPEDVWIDPVGGGLALRPGDFACLPDDPAAGLPGARVLAGEAELRAELRAVVAGHVTPVLAAFQAPLKRGPRALWGMVTDDLVSGVWYLGRMLGEEGAAVAAATALLPGDTPPFPGAAAFRTLPGTEGRLHRTRTRLGCCLYYTVRPAETCLTCPRTGDAERVRRLELPVP
ncbi:(2Fe-2S)-binding protein [Kitasatospora sp. NBC_00240]|uniref:(2Fe-2S)-binding protein n=1 Tax=Kitasatospora sp. NBC_00240 TaxID=2903567 RepID=UPI002255CA9C|nr:(2Fe-2S)-binding protein [Kitasatospora sp. NBC_00240]MCX5209609.1 (2Fe-2S)-binding protein [Kitasatospora sp. NBC_00240]